MRHLIDIIAEATIPDTQYGYWISQYAEIYPVGYLGHESFIRSVEGYDSGTAMMNGWARIVVGREVFQAEACFPVIKPRVKSKISLIARSQDYTSFIVDNHDGTGKYTVNQYALLHDFLHGMESLCRGGH